MTEAQYWQDCRNLSTEIDSATAIFEILEEVNRLALGDKAVLKCLNESALLWKVHKYSLQAALFMVLGRIFDNGPDAHSVHKVVAATVGQPQMFSKKALADRKRAGGPEPEWLHDFLLDVWEPGAADLRPLKKLLAVPQRNLNRFTDRSVMPSMPTDSWMRLPCGAYLRRLTGMKSEPSSAFCGN